MSNMASISVLNTPERSAAAYLTQEALLDVSGVTLLYKTGQQLVTATSARRRPRLQRPALAHGGARRRWRTCWWPADARR
jgi:hypothetical protein